MKGDKKRRLFLLGSSSFLLAPLWNGSRVYARSAREGPGERFQRETALTWRSVLGGLFRFKPPEPAPYKTYDDGNRIQLPPPRYRGVVLEEAIKRRRSVRSYTPTSLSLVQLSQLAYAAQFRTLSAPDDQSTAPARLRASALAVGGRVCDHGFGEFLLLVPPKFGFG